MPFDRALIDFLSAPIHTANDLKKQRKCQRSGKRQACEMARALQKGGKRGNRLSKRAYQKIVGTFLALGILLPLSLLLIPTVRLSLTIFVALPSLALVGLIFFFFSPTSLAMAHGVWRPSRGALDSALAYRPLWASRRRHIRTFGHRRSRT